MNPRTLDGHARHRQHRRLADAYRCIALAGIATVTTLLALEVALRVLTAVRAVDLFTATVHPPRSRRAELDLSGMIRPAADAGLVYELIPGLRGTFQGASVKINAQGFRGPPLPRSERSPGLRIVGLGDSITFGWGVRDHETFLSYVRRRFRNAHPGGPELEIVNLGVPGYNTHQEVEAFLARGLLYRPDVVVLFLCDNDDDLPNFVWKRAPYTMRRSFLWDFASQRLGFLVGRRASASLERTTKSIRGTHPWRSNNAADVPGPYRHMVGVDAVKRSLVRLATAARELGIPVVYAGTGGELDQQVRPLARTLHFIVVDDLADRVDAHLQRIGQGIESLQVTASDPHPNRTYHALIGESLYPALIRSLVHAHDTAPKQRNAGG